MTQLATPDDFSRELQEQRESILAMLPQPENIERFMQTVNEAIAARPELRQADRLSLYRAIKQAAASGLKPDGREGVINVYSEKVRWKDGGVWKEAWVDKAVWIPMIQGLRKRAIELASIYIEAEVVYSKDHFKVVRGDEPKIEHFDAPLGQPRGEVIGAYAIFRKLMPDNSLIILHREVMDKNQIEVVRSYSKVKDGPLWAKNYPEACRKTVARRGIKTVPAVPDALQAIFQRDDHLYDFTNSQKPVAGAAGGALMPPVISSTAAAANAPAQADAALPPATGSQMMPPPIGSLTAEAQAATPPPQSAPQAQPAAGEQLDRDGRYLAKLEAALKKAKSADQVQSIFDRQENNIQSELLPENRQKAFDMIDDYMARFDGKTESVAA